MKDFIIKSFPYNETAFTTRKNIAEFLNIIWPEPIDKTNQMTVPVTHGVELNAQSFCCYSNNLLVSYVGVVQKEISHLGNNFCIAGLNGVATLPAYQGQGIGFSVIKYATEWIEQQNNIDFGIFTCHKSLSSLYKKAGNWVINPKVILVGSHDKEALSSKTLDVVVLMRIFSEKAKLHEDTFYQEPISLDFPIGEFL